MLGERKQDAKEICRTTDKDKGGINADPLLQQGLILTPVMCLNGNTTIGLTDLA